MGLPADPLRAQRPVLHRRDRTHPRVVKRGRHNTYRVKKPTDHGTRHKAPPTITLVNLPKPQVTGLAETG